MDENESKQISSAFESNRQLYLIYFVSYGINQTKSMLMPFAYNLHVLFFFFYIYFSTDVEIQLQQASTSTVDHTAKKGMVLPFQPLSLVFNHMNYYVDMPAVCKFFLDSFCFTETFCILIPYLHESLWCEIYGFLARK